MGVVNQFVYLTILFFGSACGDIPHYDGYKNEIVGNPDDFAEIVRPCEIYDLNCIRHFFADHSKCKIVDGPAPDPAFRSQNSVYAPRVNISVIITNIEIKGLNGRIEEFYINKATDKLVIAIEFRNLSVAPADTYFKFYRKGKEPVTTTDFASILYTSLVMTTIIPNISNLQLGNAEITPFVNDFNPPISIGPRAAESSDPQVQIAIAELVADLSTTVQELILTDGIFYALTFIQHSICNFGLKVL